MQTSLSPQAFVAKWRRAELKERSASQEHFIDLCRLAGHPTPAEMDPSGQTFTFEAGATKSRGGQGWADVWKKGHFAWEYKGKHKDLDAAYQQLLQYRESLQNPPLLVVSDMDQIVIHTNFTNTVKRVEVIELEDLCKPEGLALLRALFYEPQTLRAPQTTEQVTEEAAAEFARLAELLRAYGAGAEEAAHFLIRLLFCLFAEDTGLLPKDLFTRLLQNTLMQPTAFEAQLAQLFQAMAAGGWFGVSRIAHFDGRVFDDATVLPLDSQGLDILNRVSTLDWSHIEPSIFGTLFERSLDPGKRAQLGAHYTSKEDILLIVEPVLMAPLRRRWDEVQAQAQDLARRRDEASTQRTRDNRSRELANLLMGFAEELAGVRVLDPACGSGNFLYVALRQLLDLWKAVSVLASDLGLPRIAPLPNLSPSPAQLHGIELNAYAHELAQATIWIGYIQWLHENGFGLPPEPILKPLDTIRHMDAILAYGEQREPVAPAWPESNVIIGNPPFLGAQRLRRELGDTYVDALFGLYHGRVAGAADLVTYWFERSREQIEAGKAKRAGLLATQAIRAGRSRKVLDRIRDSGDIFMAWSDRPWVLDGADIRVSMIGFDDGTQKLRELDGSRVETINADLTASIDLTAAESLFENHNLCFRCDEKGGPFDIDAVTARRMLSAPLNPNGRPNADVVRPFINALDITRRPRDMWIVDFGPDMPEEAAAMYEMPFEYVRKKVKPVRDKSKNARQKANWWLHRRAAPDMREAVAGLTRFIGTPRVARHRLFVFFDGATLPDSRVAAIAREDDYFFGILHSRVHEAWSLATSSRHGIGNDPTYNITTCFETFAFPWLPGQEAQDDPRVQAVARAARELVAQRDAWLNPEGASEQELKKRTLTNLYNQRPTWLDLAHQRLDHAVLDAYGWPHDLSDEEILEHLLALNLQRASAEEES